MKTLICIDNKSYSQCNYDVITKVNKYVENSIEEISFSTLDQTVPFVDINTAVFHPCEMDSFNNGVIIATSISNAKIILSCANSSKKVLYLYDLDWMFQFFEYDELYDILSNKNLKIIARDEDHVSPIKNLCNREPDAIINSFDLEKIWNLL